MKDVKLINGKWHAVFEETTDVYQNLNDAQKKIFGVLIECERILAKHKLKQLKNKPLNEPITTTPRGFIATIGNNIKNGFVNRKRNLLQRNSNKRTANLYR